MSARATEIESWRLDQFARAYVKAVASVAGSAVDWTAVVDDDSVDGTLRRRSTGGTVRSPQLDFQLKCTSQDFIRPDGVHFPLPLKNYNDLRPENLAVPRILVVVLVPPDVTEWTHHDESRLEVRRCGYWQSLRGRPAVENEVSKTVILPRGQLFNPPGVNGLFSLLEHGDIP